MVTSSADKRRTRLPWYYYVEAFVTLTLVLSAMLWTAYLLLRSVP